MVPTSVRRSTPVLLVVLFVGAGAAWMSSTSGFDVTTAGPFVTSAMQPDDDTLHVRCEHDEFIVPSEWRCSDTTRHMKVSAKDVEGMTMLVEARGARLLAFRLRPGTDAIFMSRSSVEQMLLAYYERTNRQRGTALRQFITRHWRPPGARSSQGPGRTLETRCEHDQFVDPSQWTCSDTTHYAQVLASEVETMTLIVDLKNGHSRAFRLNRGTDAVFLSRFAVENFLAKYYEETNQRAKAIALREYITTHWR